jgi:penicillin-binding protein 1C
MSTSDRAAGGQLPVRSGQRTNGPASKLLQLLIGSAVAAVVAAAGVVLAVEIAARRAAPPPLAEAELVSPIVVDRNGRLLRAFTTLDGRWRLPVDVADVDPRYIAMLQSFEDRRFTSHIGVDAWALLRAGGQLIRHRRAISGGSTLTMQVARLLTGEHDRTASGKIRQIIAARALEHRLSKPQILRLYLKLAPFGGNLEGIRAATLAYFGKEPKRLSIGEAALLVALPQSPEARRPDRHAAAARRARDRVLDRAVSGRVITPAEAARAKLEPVPATRRDFPKLAPHTAEAIVAQRPGQAVHRVTLDRDVQSALETLAREHARQLGPRLSAAILVIHHATGEVVAHVGSSDYLDEARLGAIDMVNAVRSPGSTLKPIIYGLGFEAGLIHPETLIEDRPVRFGTYAPKNFDEDFHGTVTIRDALAQSLNIPAVKVLNAVGPGRLMGRFRRLGLDPQMPGKHEPTLAIALGGVGLKLRELGELYAGLARSGTAVRLTYDIRPRTVLSTGREVRHAGRQVMSPVASWYVTDILRHAPPPANARGGRLAYKTGTSYGYRDAWSIGYDGLHTIAVWVGRADGTSTPGLTGRIAAAPLLFDAFYRVAAERTPLPLAPNGALQVGGAELPPPLKRFDDGRDSEPTGPYLEAPVAIAFPPDRSEIEVGSEGYSVVLKAENGALPLTWMIDGLPIASPGHSRQFEWQPEGPGFARVSVIDANGRVDRVTVRIK